MKPVLPTTKVEAILRGELAEPDVYDILEHEQRAALWAQRDCRNVIVLENLRRYAIACERLLHPLVSVPPAVSFELEIPPADFLANAYLVKEPPSVCSECRASAPSRADGLCGVCSRERTVRYIRDRLAAGWGVHEMPHWWTDDGDKVAAESGSKIPPSAPSDGICASCRAPDRRRLVDGVCSACECARIIAAKPNPANFATMTVRKAEPPRTEATSDTLTYDFRLGELHGAVAFDGRFLRLIGDKGRTGLDAMACEVREMLRQFFEELGPEMLFEELARWLFATDPEVIAFIDRASEAPLAKVQKEPKWNREGLMRKRCEHLATAWERNEPKGARKRALLRAKAVWKEMEAGR